MPKSKPVPIGQSFGRLVVSGLYPVRDNAGKKVFTCVCTCGKTVNVARMNLLSGNTTSCGCYSKELLRTFGKRIKHGATVNGQHTPEYRSWTSMKNRCYNVKNVAYKNYGGKGITVEACWLNFNTFLADMGFRPRGTSLDRVDGTQGYNRLNCKWATAKEQNRHRSSDKLTMEIAGLIRSSTESINMLAKRYKVCRGTISAVLKNKTWI